MAIQFVKKGIKNTFLDPRKDFSPITQEMEMRLDPLTGKRVRLAHFGSIKPQPLDLDSYKNPGFCPFCPPQRDKITPKFLPELISQGRLSQGEALLTPNISPYDDYSALVIMSKEHVLSLEDLSFEILNDSLEVACQFLGIVKEKEPHLPYHYLGWNYMPPSGGGLVHPHIQVFASHTPPNPLEIEGAVRFLKKTTKNFYHAYIEREKEKKERYIGQVGKTHWLSAFAPAGVLGEYICVLPSVYTIEDFTPECRKDLIEGLLKLFKCFIKEGIYSFNAAFLFGPAEQSFYPLHVRIIPRTFLNTQQFPPDANFLQMLLQEPLCVVWPEDVCENAKVFF